MHEKKKQIHCEECGGLFQKSDGPTHRYLKFSPGCWACYGEVLAREYSDSRYRKVHRLTVDSYAVQHPGHPSPQSIQSVALHLISLYLVLEKQIEMHSVTRALQYISQHKEMFRWLPPPANRGKLTIADVHRAKNAREYIHTVHAWANSTWASWEEHHEIIKEWAEDL